MPEARDAVDYRFGDGIAWLAVANPPVNTLSRRVREGLGAALDRAEAEPGLRAVVLMGAGATFSAGADLAELGKPSAGPAVVDLCARLEGFLVPVVAAIHGTALGSGLELALAAHYRIALSSARLGFPEVRLGLIPAAGGTQRLARMIGAKGALDMLLGGGMFAASRAPARGLLDAVAEGDLRAATEGFVRQLLETGQGPRRGSEMRQGFAEPAAYQKEVARRREAAARQPEIAPRELVAAVEAAMLLPFEAGLAFEADVQETCLASDQSRALRAAFVSEGMAGRLGLPGGAARPALHRLAVLGGGGLAAQLVFTALNAGLELRWGASDPEAFLTGVPQLRDAFAEAVKRGALTEEQAQDRMAGLKVGDSASMAADADMVVLAAQGLGEVPVPEGTVRAIACAGEVEALGLRFSASRLVEVVAGPGVSASELAAAQALVRSLGKIAVRVTSRGETMAARLVAACQRAADALVDAGQNPYDIDRAFRDWGWTRPPFEARDRMGLSELATQPRADGARNWSALLLGAGRGGRAAGRGMYDWTADPSVPREDSALKTLLDAERPSAAAMPPDLIRKRVLGAMANEGARMLASGMALRPSDIDVVALHALEMPRWRGGPMHLAGVMKLLALRRAMEGFDHPDRAFWAPEPIFAELAKNGRSFDDLNAEPVSRSA
ncbi:enoyl-CoA hydratase-related protein [Salipiger thiooxidans]|uniref:enoyl-CoA hydratase-related protein n=1 Tax=Salipiger thiooxidans TaxID=282683 RepID=UPI001CD4BAF6|nr:enoyl-CoA hydratase-related protein [Salipiger thiooxidans]MCA0845674.1 enoyl-CoA hydratase/isomerase family protein [Salipiger thiooxidans]